MGDGVMTVGNMNGVGEISMLQIMNASYVRTVLLFAEFCWMRYMHHEQRL